MDMEEWQNGSSGYGNGQEMGYEIGQGPGYGMNQEPEYEMSQELARESLLAGKKIKELFKIEMIMLVGMVIFFVIAIVTIIALLVGAGVSYKSFQNDLSFLGETGIGVTLVGLIFVLILLGAVVLYSVVYLETLYGLTKHDSNFTKAFWFSIAGLICGVLVAFFPQKLSWIRDMTSTLLGGLSIFFIAKGIENLVGKIDASRARVVHTFARGYIFCISIMTVTDLIKVFMPFLANLILLATSLVQIGLFIWYYVILWSSGSFLERYGISKRR